MVAEDLDAYFVSYREEPARGDVSGAKVP